MKRHACLIPLLLTSCCALADPAGQQVLQCMRQNLPPSESIKEIEMDSVDRRGVRSTMQGKLYAHVEAPAGQPPQLSLALQFEEPRDLSGTAYLVRRASGGEGQVYLYLPALQRVRRINPGAASGSLLGTSFSYSDFSQLQSAFDSADATLEGSADGGATQVLAIRPSGQPSPYTLVRAWVDRRSCVPLKAEFLAGTVVKKRFHAETGALRQSGRYWYPAESTIEDLAQGSTTTLRVARLVSGVSLPGSYFLPTSFYLPN